MNKIAKNQASQRATKMRQQRVKHEFAVNSFTGVLQPGNNEVPATVSYWLGAEQKKTGLLSREAIADTINVIH